MPIDEVHQGLPQQVTVTKPRQVPRPPPALRPELVPAPADEVEYPSDDGNPMAAGLDQAYAMVGFHYMLQRHYKGREDVFVALDLLVYYTEGNRNASVAPDVFVAQGVSSEMRQFYKVWEEGKVPDFVIEFASQRTAAYDAAGKKDLYQSLGVQEYWLYDPTGGLHAPRLQGFVMQGGVYGAIRPEQRDGVQRALRSEVLGLELHFDGERLRVWDPVREEYYLTPAETDEQAISEAQARESAEAAQQAAEAAQMEAEAARQAAEARARSEAEARAAAEARLAELEAALAAARRPR